MTAASRIRPTSHQAQGELDSEAAGAAVIAEGAGVGLVWADDVASVGVGAGAGPGVLVGTGAGAGAGTGAGAGAVVGAGLVVFVMVGVVAGELAVERLGTGTPVLAVEMGDSGAEGAAVAGADRLGAPLVNALPAFPPPPPHPDKSRAEAAIITAAAPAPNVRTAGRDWASRIHFEQ